MAVTLDQARLIIARFAGSGGNRHASVSGLEPYSARFHSGAPSEREALIDAFVALTLGGTNEESEWSTTFLATHPLDETEMRPLVDAYLAAPERPACRAIGRAIGRFNARIAPDQLAALRTHFLATSSAWLELSALLLFRFPEDPDVWSCFAACVTREERIEALEEAYEATVFPERSPDFAALLRGRPPHVLEALIARLPVEGAALIRAVTHLS